MSTTPSASRRQRDARHGLILVVVLVMVALLSLLAASYTYMVRAHIGEAMTTQQRFQAKMAAQGGIMRAVSVLRGYRFDPSVWYHQPALFQAQFVSDFQDEQAAEVQQSPDYQSRAGQTGEDRPAQIRPAWRFHLLAPNPEDPTTLRYGLTDECARLNLNLATEGQLRRLFQYAIPQETMNPIDINVLVDSLLDWRSQGAMPRPNGAKDEYYQALQPPYRCKQARFDTIEELLLVRGFSAWIVFGEDYNQNGLLDPNEDDGDASFPPDNGDGRLFAGVAPFFTLWSNDVNVARDGSPRIDLNMEDAQKLQDKLSEFLSGPLLNYVVGVRAANKRFNSVMNLLPAPPPEEAPEGGEEPPPASQPASSQPSASSAPFSSLQNPATPLGGSTDLGRSPPTSQKSGQAPIAFADLTETPPPGTYQDLPLILDRLTVSNSPFVAGRINVCTAPREVIATLEELTEEEIDKVMSARLQLAPEDRWSSAWLVTSGAISENRFRQILNKITTHSTVFRMESLGYADHVGMVHRMSVILEMRGPIPQVLYTRSLNGLGTAYEPHSIERRGPLRGLSR